MEKVAIVGASGSGKSTLAATLAEILGATRIDLDELFHQPDWEPTPTPEFRARVTAATNDEQWVVAGNYSVVYDIIHGGADTIVWLDLSRWRSTGRVIRRSIGRAVRREELWNGNREHWRDLLSRDPERNIILWAWQSHPKHRSRFGDFAEGKFWAHADVQRLTTPAEVRDFLERARDQAASSSSASSVDG